MRLSLSLLLTTVLVLVIPTPLPSQEGMPKMTSVEPGSGKVGDELTVSGENLSKGAVAALYLTDGKTDWKVAVVSQTDTAIKFKIPPEAKPGRFSLMILTVSKPPKLIEQPVKVSVE